MIYLPFIVAAFAGIFRAAYSARDNYRKTSLFAEWFNDSPRLSAWYEGGNKAYDPRFEFTADFKHTMIWAMLYAWGIAVLLAVSFPLDGYAVLCYLLLPRIEGLVFSLFHAVIFGRDMTFRFWITKNILVFWKNWRTMNEEQTNPIC